MLVPNSAEFHFREIGKIVYLFGDEGVIFIFRLKNKKIKEEFNMNSRYLFTSKSVTEGHPDKIADQISDAILDDVISKDSCRIMMIIGDQFSSEPYH
jgi:hypothetical protein